MFLTILSTLLGILSSAIPNLLSIWEKSLEAKYQLELLRLKNEAAKAGLDTSKDIVDMQTLVQEGENVRAYDSQIDGGIFINALRASVRPVITYTIFFLFIFVKMSSFVLVVRQGLSVENVDFAMKAIFDDNSMAIFSAIVGFWFGSRAIEKFARNKIVINTSETSKET